MTNQPDVQINDALLTKMCSSPPNKANLHSVIQGLQTFGPAAGLLNPVNLMFYLGQIMSESGNFKYDKEIWGSTAAQKKYEGRADLGNTQKGDGKKFMGHTAAQITGRGNTTKFYKWCLKNASALGITIPDFVSNPDLMNTDPIEGAGPIWYWDIGNPEGVSLNKYAQVGNLYMVTQRVNGGQNGADTRRANTVRAGLVLAGYAPTDVKGFQKDNGLTVDGDPGQETFKKLVSVLGGKNPDKQVVTVAKPVAVEVPKPVKIAALDKPWYTTKEGITQAVMGPLGAPAIGFVQGLDWTKIAAWGAVGLVATAVYFGFRYYHKKHQDDQVAQIQSDANDARDDIATQADKAQQHVRNLRAQ